MNKTLLEYAYTGLLYDIEKFYQKTMNNSLQKIAGYHSLDVDEDIVKTADKIASEVDVDKINEDMNQNMDSIMCEVDFGKKRHTASFPIKKIDSMTNPIVNYKNNAQENIQQYQKLYQQFLDEVNKDHLLDGEVTPYKYNRMYALLYRYTTLIPYTSYESTVALYDHLKLTSAIASCLYYQNENKFYMLEFDVSGIQKFIYQITEGSKTKANIAKSLRGRSAFVSLLTSSITYAFLNEFSLTQANIISNTGGGAIILLPYLDDTMQRVETLCTQITNTLYANYNTQLTFVYAIEEMNEDELKRFKIEKALSLKAKLDQEKNQKYKNIIDGDFSLKKISRNDLCEMCGDNLKDKGSYCKTCQLMIDISDAYTGQEKMSIWYDFDCHASKFDLDYVTIHFIDKDDLSFKDADNYFYIDAINHFNFGNVKMVANLVPKKNHAIMSFDEMVHTLDKSYGDQKLGILKMDVDNLGAVFAFGLKQNNNKNELQRSLSKYSALSRFIELFFSMRLKQICYDVSRKLHQQHNIFYINYAGGDDLVILGPVYGIVLLAREIRQEFEKYASNLNITLSAGIHIQSSRKPIRFGILQADEALETSKNYQKNGILEKDAITIMGITVSFKDFYTILDKVEKYKNHLKNSEVSRTSFYHMMNIIQVDHMDKFYPLIPKIQYSLYRQLKNDAIRLDLVKEITQVQNLYELDRVVLMMKLVILFTRED